MKPTQDPKYGIDEEGRLCNICTGKPIPDDEPIFIFRAQDVLAEQTLSFYLTMVAVAEHRAAVQNRIGHFQQFRIDHPDRVKSPSTVFPYPVLTHIDNT